ncbi:hypothetical protein SAMN05444392_101736 [Seinonella peptonophila]|uniref:Uncharacterized protein n=1 Tax=Seinonella peptonophila TaxID=112248 RepID=A0A1M4TZY2_9BACL|nr:hypothetical protein [Seinonella peptonophila]SHE50072.1 hypothetical protein SAMN05444392_101736 [Seinonella peptonophila]
MIKKVWTGFFAVLFILLFYFLYTAASQNYILIMFICLNIFWIPLYFFVDHNRIRKKLVSGFLYFLISVIISFLLINFSSFLPFLLLTIVVVPFLIFGIPILLIVEKLTQKYLSNYSSIFVFISNFVGGFLISFLTLISIKPFSQRDLTDPIAFLLYDTILAYLFLFWLIDLAVTRFWNRRMFLSQK